MFSSGSDWGAERAYARGMNALLSTTGGIFEISEGEEMPSKAVKSIKCQHVPTPKHRLPTALGTLPAGGEAANGEGEREEEDQQDDNLGSSPSSSYFNSDSDRTSSSDFDSDGDRGDSPPSSEFNSDFGTAAAAPTPPTPQALAPVDFSNNDLPASELLSEFDSNTTWAEGSAISVATTRTGTNSVLSQYPRGHLPTTAAKLDAAAAWTQQPPGKNGDLDGVVSSRGRVSPPHKLRVLGGTPARGRIRKPKPDKMSAAAGEDDSSKPRAPTRLASTSRAAMSPHAVAMAAARRMVEERGARLGTVREEKKAALMTIINDEAMDPVDANQIAPPPAVTPLEQRRQLAKTWAKSRDSYGPIALERWEAPTGYLDTLDKNESIGYLYGETSDKELQRPSARGRSDRVKDAATANQIATPAAMSLERRRQHPKAWAKSRAGGHSPATAVTKLAEEERGSDLAEKKARVAKNPASQSGALAAVDAGSGRRSPPREGEELAPPGWEWPWRKKWKKKTYATMEIANALSATVESAAEKERDTGLAEKKAGAAKNRALKSGTLVAVQAAAQTAAAVWAQREAEAKAEDAAAAQVARRAADARALEAEAALDKAKAAAVEANASSARPSQSPTAAAVAAAVATEPETFSAAELAAAADPASLAVRSACNVSVAAATRREAEAKNTLDRATSVFKSRSSPSPLTSTGEWRGEEGAYLRQQEEKIEREVLSAHEEDACSNTSTSTSWSTAVDSQVATLGISDTLHMAEPSITPDDIDASLANACLTSPPRAPRAGVAGVDRWTPSPAWPPSPAGSGGSGLDSSSEDERFRQQATPYSGLNELLVQDPTAVGKLGELTAEPRISSSSPGIQTCSSVHCEESCKEMDALAKMAYVLQEVASSWAQDTEIQRKELALGPDSFQGAYYTTLRGGICSSYYAACVIASDMVATSKTGAMGTAGKALSVLAGMAPIFPGLKTLAAGLKEGDRFLQTRSIVKIAEVVDDVMECSALAKRVALRLTDALADENHLGQQSREDVSSVSFEGTGWSTGSVPPSADVEDREDAMEWFVEEVLSGHLTSHGEGKTHSAKEGQRMGRSHLKVLLKALGRGCVGGERDINAKVEILVRVVLRGLEGKSCPTPQDTQECTGHATSSAHTVFDPSGIGISRPLDGGGAVESEAREAMLTEQVKALKASHESLDATSASLVAQNIKLEAEVEATNATIDDLVSQNAKLEEGLEALNATIDELVAQNAKLEGGLEASNATIDELVAQNGDLEAGLEASRITGEELVAQNARFEARVEASKATIAELVAQNSDLEASVEASKSTSTALVAQNLKLRGDLEASNATIAELVAQNSDLEASVEASRTTTSKIAKMESEMETLKKMLEKLAPESDGWVANGGGQGLIQRTRKSLDGFSEGAQDTTVRDDHHRPVTQYELREHLAVQSEINRDNSASIVQLQGASDAKKANQKRHW